MSKQIYLQSKKQHITMKLLSKKFALKEESSNNWGVRTLKTPAPVIFVSMKIIQAKRRVAYKNKKHSFDLEKKLLPLGYQLVAQEFFTKKKHNQVLKCNTCIRRYWIKGRRFGQARYKQCLNCFNPKNTLTVDYLTAIEENLLAELYKTQGVTIINPES